MKIVFFDTETTGNTATDYLCQLAIKERGVAEPIVDAIYKPPVPIPFECSAIHHISNKMVADRPAFKDAPEYAAIKALLEDENTICVAHNAAFDEQILKNDDIVIKNLLCTFKTIRVLDEEEGKFIMHKLQYLRYALDIDLDVSSHEALADVLVLERLFEYELAEVMKKWSCDEQTALAKMMEMTRQPLSIKTFNFGKYNGKTVAEVASTDIGYLSWLLDQKRKNEKDEADWIYTLEKYVN
ncbi:MAG TPA: exonuclease domain-containing protein [Candidatus Paceibacterota bacterium]|jgi:DNA polymerase III epsilon subunit-like protein|nr:exonuclease domain-containing protein [Candidatus Paceibacterota bacterium]